MVLCDGDEQLHAGVLNWQRAPAMVDFQGVGGYRRTRGCTVMARTADVFVKRRVEASFYPRRCVRCSFVGSCWSGRQSTRLLLGVQDVGPV